jgi:hypothetical protein
MAGTLGLMDIGIGIRINSFAKTGWNGLASPHVRDEMRHKLARNICTYSEVLFDQLAIDSG